MVVLYFLNYMILGFVKVVVSYIFIVMHFSLSNEEQRTMTRIKTYLLWEFFYVYRSYE